MDAISRLQSQRTFSDLMTTSMFHATTRIFHADSGVTYSDLEDAHVIPALIHKCYLAKSASFRHLFSPC